MIKQQPLPPIFVISLARAKNRRAHISAELEKRNLPYQIIDAVDGALLDDEIIDKVYDEKAAISNFGRALSRGEIGCSMSHLSIYQKMLKEDIAMAIVLEDDVVITDDFLPIIENIEPALPQKWQLILLGYCSWEHDFLHLCQMQVGKPNKLLNFTLKKPLNLAFATHAYLINQQGAAHFLQKTKPLYQPIDYYTGDYKLTDVYCVNPRCVMVDRNLDSIIAQERLQVHPQSVDNLKKYWLIKPLILLNRKYEIRKTIVDSKFVIFCRCFGLIMLYKIHNAIFKG